VVPVFRSGTSRPPDAIVGRLVTRGIPITSRAGVQAVAPAFAGALGVSAYFFATTGWGTPFAGCWPALSRPAALSVAAFEIALAFGFVVAALRGPSGPKDPLLVAMVLALFAALAVGGGVYTLATGVARFGKSGCLEAGAPWSYGLGILAIFAGAVALYAAAMPAVRHRESD
jgi:hypothetical protein